MGVRNFLEIMNLAKVRDCIIGGFNVYGLDDAKAVVEAAEELNAPTILMINKQALSMMNVEYWADAMKSIAKRARVPVCVHLDHATEFNIAKRAVDAGFDSIMFDGSQLPLEENIAKTKEIVKYIHDNGKIAEAEIGAVGYSDRDSNEYKAMMTDPFEAKQFADETKVDWLAISVGNVHRMEEQAAKINFDLLAEIEKNVSLPLVIHGSTGITDDDMAQLMKTHVAKANIGTALRMAFGNTLRQEFENNPSAFDRSELFKKPIHNVNQIAKEKMLTLKLKGFFRLEIINSIT